MNNLEQPPKTIEEVGIHLFYMARAVADLDKTVQDYAQNYATKDVTNDLEQKINKLASKTTVDEHNTRITKLETKNIIKDTLLWVGLVASAIINIIFIYNLFSGGTK